MRSRKLDVLMGEGTSGTSAGFNEAGSVRSRKHLSAFNALNLHKFGLQ